MSTVGKCDIKDTADSKKSLKKDKKKPKTNNTIKGYDADTEKESQVPCESVDDNFSLHAKEIDDNVKIMSYLEI